MYSYLFFWFKKFYCLGLFLLVLLVLFFVHKKYLYAVSVCIDTPVTATFTYYSCEYTYVGTVRIPKCIPHSQTRTAMCVGDSCSWSVGNSYKIRCREWGTGCIFTLGAPPNPCPPPCTPVDGGWSSWSSCSLCRMTRTCTNPTPSCGGDSCVGSSWINCGYVSGVCGSLNTCVHGTVTGITTEPFPGGINNVWYCLGACGGTTAKCTSLKCTAVNGISTMCVGDRLCTNGITASNVRDDGVDYIWDCIGTAGSCNGIDGSSQTGCRYSMAADSWFQTSGGGILGKSSITNYVPLTCGLSGDCTEAISIGGLVAAPIINGTTNIPYSSPNDWYMESDMTKMINYFGKYKNITGVGTTLIEGDLNDSNIINNTNGLLMVDGDVTISQNKITLVGNFSMIVASGDITVEPSVTRFDGILAGNNIDIGGSNATQLTINGSLYGTNNVNLTRSYIDKANNNDSPAIVVNYRPDFIFNMPISMVKSVIDWKWGN